VCPGCHCLAVCTTINPTIKHSPCHLAFNQDMIFRHAVQINWDAIHHKRQISVIISNAKENKSCLTHQCTPGDKVLTVLDSDKHHGQPKMNQPTKGPFTITTVHNNGTVDINCVSFIETIDICKPFHS
jgi:hypothetical protein